jgi:hypothetical protein
MCRASLYRAPFRRANALREDRFEPVGDAVDGEIPFGEGAAIVAHLPAFDGIGRQRHDLGGECRTVIG